MGVELFHADGRTDVTNLIVASGKFKNTPKNEAVLNTAWFSARCASLDAEIPKGRMRLQALGSWVPYGLTLRTWTLKFILRRFNWFVYFSYEVIFDVVFYFEIRRKEVCRRSSVGVAIRYGLDGPGIESRRSRWPRGLRRGLVAVRLLGLRVRIPTGAWMFVLCV